LETIRLEKLTYCYKPDIPGEKNAIENIDLSINKGEFIGVIGHTGSGKSTMISHLNGLLRPTSGKVYINGEDIWAKPKEIRKVRFAVGLVMQYPEYQLFEETVFKDIAFGPANMGLSEKEIADRVYEAMDFVGLPRELAEASPFDLSGGQKRRVAIAGVMAMRPEILILDEPTAGLDPAGRQLILDQVKAYHEVNHNTVILVSHSMEDIAKYAGRVLVIHEGAVADFDLVNRVFAKAEKLTEMGLSVPQISKVFMTLRERGFDLPDDIYTVDAACDTLISRLLEVEGC